ncbi:DUF3823 domain-containing protein [Bacteroides intestinalis]|jgi:hypothetical protein|uniref:DUF3823 domain-containing protein n=1 Tax=Bacteroides intestinalis TaxID=329854 RepID=UPI00164A4D1D|nr:DUF3823 domain-containing protein [Bacteroides intestinalis]
MKNINSLILILGLFLVTGCELDNFDEPKSEFKGRFVYEGEALQLRGTAYDNDCMMYAYQEGPEYENRGAINLFVNSDGEFNSLMYDGFYKIVLRQDRGPWIPRQDTIEVNIKGNQILDVEVTPYFLIKDTKIDFQNKVVKVKCKINQVVETASIDRAVIYISKTKLVDNVAKIAEKSFTNLNPGEHEFTFDLSDNGVTDAAKFLYARVGVKARQGNDYIFSEVTQLR